MRLSIYRGYICATYAWDSMAWTAAERTMWSVHSLATGVEIVSGCRGNEQRARQAARAKVRHLHAAREVG